MIDADPTFIATIRKNASEDVRLALSEFNGHFLIDVRIFADLGAGDRKPTRKGIALSIRALPDLIAGLEEAADEARRRGLLSEPDR